jgi:DNA modification methylase
MSKHSSKNVIEQKLFKSKVAKMPEGYYSGDQPNPNLRAFVEAHLREKPYDPRSDTYNVSAFDKPIETTKATAIYNMHTYWSKKPHDAIRQYIRHYTEPGDLVLDPFCGSGGTALAALMEGRKAIAIDRSPAATFITKNYCTPVDVDELKEAFEELKERVKPELHWLYETRCDRCGGKATTAYTVYSQVFECPRCLSRVPLFDCVEVKERNKAGKWKKIKACPYCLERDVVEEISTRGEKYGSVPVLVSYICEEGCKPKRDSRRHNDSDPDKREYFVKYDLAKLQEIEERDIPYWYPTDRMMHAPDDQECWGVKWRAGTSNFRTVDELFTKRNLWALAVIRNGIQSDSHLLLAFNSVLLNSSKLYRNREGGGGGSTGNYYIAQENREMNVWNQFESKVSEYLRIKSQWCTSVIVSTESAIRMATIKNSSVDYIFTDPPYAEKVQYGELNFIWEAWLGFDTHWHDEEIIVNEIRGKTVKDWEAMMRMAMSECHRVLKPGRWLSLCYHDTSEGTWTLVQDIMAEIGFLPDKSESTLYIDTGQKSYNQQRADKVNKRDLVINFRKPKPCELVSGSVTLKGTEDTATFREKLHMIVREYLTAHPGSTKDRIYDEVVSRMVRRGQMEVHNFDELLRQVADEIKEPVKKNLFEHEEPNLFETHEIGRWYLKETETVVDKAETAKEDAAAQHIGRFIRDWLEKHPEKEGVHYSDIFEHYIAYLGTLKDRPRRQLQDWLVDYFYKTDEGTYRLPANEEEERAKAQGRAAGINRRIKRYVIFLEQGVPLPEKEIPGDATIAQWIRTCKRSGLYREGKLLYEKGGLNLENLSEEAAVNVEEDYQVCVRMLNRPMGKAHK